MSVMKGAGRVGFMLLCLTTSPAWGAAAERTTWVLWVETQIPSSLKSMVGGEKLYEVRWKPVGGFETAKACETSAAAHIARYRTVNPTAKTGFNVYSSLVMSVGDDTTYTYFCLPDTVDPREPKGK
jgi:hypothetical protein